MTDESVARPDEQPVLFLIHRLSRSLLRASVSYYQQTFGLGVPQVQILHALGNHPSLVSKEIADFTAMNKALVSRSLSELTDLGYTETSMDASDARKRIWSLTAKGRALVQTARPIRQARAGALLNVLAPSEREDLIRILNLLYASSEALRVEETRQMKAKRRKQASKAADTASASQTAKAATARSRRGKTAGGSRVSSGQDQPPAAGSVKDLRPAAASRRST